MPTAQAERAGVCPAREVLFVVCASALVVFASTARSPVVGGNYAVPGDFVIGGVVQANATRTDLQPGVPFPHDLGARFRYSNLGFPLSFNINESGSITQNYPDPGFFGGPKIIPLNVNWGVDLTVTLSEISYDLSGVAPQAIPEASSMARMGVVAIAAGALAAVRRR